MTLQRMDNVLIVVDDLAATKAFFVALGMELEGETTVEGPAVDRLIGLQAVHFLDVPAHELLRGLVQRDGLQ